jgi:transcriptional regulator with AAA-type ATPase domain/transcriptional regulatory protein LevR
MDEVYTCLCEISSEKGNTTANDISRHLNLARCNVSAYLTRLVEEGKVHKTKTRPVCFLPANTAVSVHPSENLSTSNAGDVFSELIGYRGSMKAEIEKAKAAVQYPPKGLSTLICGETGCGKSLLAEKMYLYAIDQGKIEKNVPFVIFNCANYASNPQLITSQLFGYKKGSFTGADADTPGLIDKAAGGVLFLDEIHRFPPDAQEMLFLLMDKGLYSRLGDTHYQRKADIILIFATTENPESALLRTFLRRIPVIIKLPTLKERSLDERLELIKCFFQKEVRLLNTPMSIQGKVIHTLMYYEYTGNIGQLLSDIRMICARSYLRSLVNNRDCIFVTWDDLQADIKKHVLYNDSRDYPIDFVEEEIEISPSEAAVVESEESGKTFYNYIHGKYLSYIVKSYSREQILQYMENDLAEFFITQYTKYLSNKSLSQIQLITVMSSNILRVVEQAVPLMEDVLGHAVSREVVVVLALHLSEAVKRVDGDTSDIGMIEDFHKKFRESYPEIYRLAESIVRLVYDVAHIQLPAEETVYIAKMVLTFMSEAYSFSKKVLILVLTHGDGCARSMVYAAKQFIPANNIIWYDLGFNKNNKDALEEVMVLVRQQVDFTGVLMLVDFGILTLFGEELKKRLNLPVHTVDQVTLNMVIRAAQMTARGAGLEEVYATLLNPTFNLRREEKNQHKIILAVCITGEGVASRLKQILESRYNLHEFITVKTLDIDSMEELNQNWMYYSQQGEIIAVAGIAGGKALSVPFFSLEDLLFGDGFDRLGIILKTYGVTVNGVNQRQNKPVAGDAGALGSVLANYLNYMDGTKMVPVITDVLDGFISMSGIVLEQSSYISLLLHICCMVERLLFDSDLRKIYTRMVNRTHAGNEPLRIALQNIEKVYKIYIPDDEIEEISKMLNFWVQNI